MNIVHTALRELALSTEHFDRAERAEAIDKLLELARTQALDDARRDLFVGSFYAFEVARRDHGRIPAIKLVRERLGVGLTEALIIIKGIETHHRIPSSGF